MAETTTAPVTPSTPKTTTEALLQAASTAVWVAAPDWVSTTRQRRVVRGVALAVTAAAAASHVARTRHERAQEPEGSTCPVADDGADDGSPWRRRAVVGTVVVGGVAAALAVHHGSERLTARGVRVLERRGVRRPWTLVGLGWGAATLAVDLVERRTLDAPAQQG